MAFKILKVKNKNGKQNQATLITFARIKNNQFQPSFKFFKSKSMKSIQTSIKTD